jgi:phosphoribosylamine--glycine ligase
MNVLVIGGGGREHALAWKLNQSPRVETVYCAPGNPGMDGIECLDISDYEELADFAGRNNVGLTVVGPEAPLCDGVVDLFKSRGLTVFGPSQNAAQLEGSKAFAKRFMDAHGIPTAAYGEFDNAEDAIAYIRQQGAPIVVKADGLAAGKGVIVAQTDGEAIDAVNDCFEGAFGAAGYSVVVEECLIGEEASIIALVDGKTVLPLASSQDHKRVGEGDTGPNTGGMGAYSPAPVVTDELWKQVNEKVLNPFLNGIQKENLDFKGVIYAGIMVTQDGPKVLEFNVRFGDPETQAILVRMKSDLAEAMLATVAQKLDQVKLEWTPEPAVCVVMASGGYPGNYEKGFEITGLEKAAKTGAIVFHAGTGMRDGKLVNNGGRVLGVTACGTDLPAALETAYDAVDVIHWDGCFYRRDIAHRALDAQSRG